MKYLVIFVLLISIRTFSQPIMADSYAGGSGTSTDPYQIETFEQLLRLSEITTDWSKNFVLTADIDASASKLLNIQDDGTLGFSPIGSYSGVRQNIEFTGNFDGQGHIIFNLYINRPNEDYVGLFGYKKSNRVRYLGLYNVDITGNNYVGAVIGYSSFCNIFQVFSTGTVSGNETVGGLTGLNFNNGSVTNCYSFADVNGEAKVGGLIGYKVTGVTMENNYFAGTVTSNDNAGGITTTTDVLNNENNYFDSITTSIKTGSSGIYPIATEDFVDITELGFNYSSYWTLGIIPEIDANPRPYFHWQFDYVIATQSTTSNYTTTPLSQGLFAGDNVVIETTKLNIYYEFKGWVLGTDTICKTTSYQTVLSPNSATEKLTYRAIYVTNYPFGGSGTSSDPYKISNYEELELLSMLPELWGKHFILISDIDASPSKSANIIGEDTLGFSPIGAYTRTRQTIKFTGGFNGNGHIISNLYINRPNENYVGLFGYVHSDNYLKNIVLENVDITGGSYTGGLIGYLLSSDSFLTYSLKMNNVLVSGEVTGVDNVGGLAGVLNGATHSEIVSFANVSGNLYVGGLVGRVTNSFFIRNSYSIGTVSGAGNIGGLAGLIEKGVAIIDGEFRYCYYDKETTGLSDIQEWISALKTSSFAYKDSLTGFDFENIWAITLNNRFDSVARPYFNTMLPTFEIEFRVGGNGNISGNSVQQISLAGNSEEIVAIPDDGFVFEKWVNPDGSVVSVNKAFILHNVMSDSILTAIFIPAPTISFSAIQNGILEYYNKGISSTAEEATYAVAHADEGYHFSNWQNSDGVIVSVEDSLDLSIFVYDVTLTAIFEKNIYDITFSHNEHGSLEGNLSQSVLFEGVTTPVTAIPDEHYILDHWEYSDGTYISSANPISISNVSKHMNIVAVFAFAPAFAGGKGTQYMPYKIENFDQLVLLSTLPEVWDKYFELIADIDASESGSMNIVGTDTLGFSPIGAFKGFRQGIGFKGQLDGKFHSINNLYINRPTEKYVGLFGFLDEKASIKNLGVSNSKITGDDTVGIVVGYANRYATISKVYSTGAINADRYVGGIAGVSKTDIEYCFSFANITATAYVGGIVGYAYFGSVKQCYFLGKYTVTYTGNAGIIYGYKYNTYIDNTNFDFENIWSNGILPDIDTISHRYFKELFDYIVSTKVSPELTGTSSDTRGYLSGQIAKIETQSSNEYCNFVHWLLKDKIVSVDSSYTFQVPAYTGNKYYEELLYTAVYHEIYANSSNGYFSGGDGSLSDPFKIATFSDLVVLSKSINLLDNHFILVADINADSSRFMNIEGSDALGFFPIGDRSDKAQSHGVAFTGTFNGNGHIISNLYINRPSVKFAGLFGGIEDGAMIYDLGVVDADITGSQFCGIITGYGSNCRIDRVFSSGSVNSGGGLIGYLGESYVNDVFSLANIKSGSGLVNSLVSSEISNAYACGNVESGYGLFSNIENSTTIDCYFDRTTTTQNAGFVASTINRNIYSYETSSFAVRDSFPGFDFENTWKFAYISEYDNVIRPYFKWMNYLTFELSLDKGWNFISLPLTPLTQIVDSVFPNAVIVKNADVFFDTTQANYFNTLKVLEAGEAYLLKNAISENIPIVGIPSTIKETKLTKGWNMLGIPRDSIFRINTLPFELGIIKNFDGFYEYADPLSSLTHLIPGTGYFTYATSACNINWYPKSSSSVPIENSGTLSDIDGNVYPWVRIGNQCWMARNLRVSRYADGTPLLLAQNADDWNTAWFAGEKIYCFYDTTGTGYPYFTKEVYGALYILDAATRGEFGFANPSRVQGICPDGWHLPSDKEWLELELFLAEHGYDALGQSCDSTETNTAIRNECAYDSFLGKAITANFGWNYNDNYAAVGNSDFPEKRNISGFTAVPGGSRNFFGEYGGIGNNTWWWSASVLSEDSGALMRGLYGGSPDTFRDHNSIYAQYVRCVKD